MPSCCNWFKKLTPTHLLLLFLLSMNLIKTLSERKYPIENITIRDKNGKLQSEFTNHPGTSVTIKIRDSNCTFTMLRPREDTRAARNWSNVQWVVCQDQTRSTAETRQEVLSPESCCSIGKDPYILKSTNMERHRRSSPPTCGVQLGSPEGIGILVFVSLAASLSCILIVSGAFVFRRRTTKGKEEKQSSDFSMGRENLPISVMNEVDSEKPPASPDFQYVPCLVQTLGDIVVERDIGDFVSCSCEDDCSSDTCTCNKLNSTDETSEGCAYNTDGTLKDYILELRGSDIVYECTVACHCMWNCRNRVAQKGIRCHLEVFRTLDRGWGVRCLEPIPIGTFVCEYGGEMVTADEICERNDSTYLYRLDEERSGEVYYIDGKSYGNVSRFINHSCNPNMIPLRALWDHQDERFCHIVLYARKNIKKLEELTSDYGEDYWILRHNEGIGETCKCGSNECKYNSENIEKNAADYNKRKREEKKNATQKDDEDPSEEKPEFFDV